MGNLYYMSSVRAPMAYGLLHIVTMVQLILDLLYSLLQNKSNLWFIAVSNFVRYSLTRGLSSG